VNAAPSGPSERLTGFARGFIERAARCAPASLSERLEEEWLAELAARSGTLSRLRFAVGCYWASKTIARDGWAGAPAVLAAVHGERALAAYFKCDSNFLSRRALTICFIVALHVVLIYAVSAGLIARVASAIPQSIEVSVSEELQPHPQALPPPEPKLVVPKTAIPMPDVVLTARPDPTVIPALVQHGERAALPPPPPSSIQRPEIRVLGGPGPGFPKSDDYYPPDARRLGHEGVATVQVCVDPDGRLTSDPRIAQSSGHSRIDQGALRLAHAGSGHYRPTTDNGLPVNDCFAYRIRFQLRD
jgi:periplasmic protein TonB